MKEVIFNSQFKEPLVIALGFFDSIHRGHRAIIDKVLKISDDLKCLPAVMTFTNNPYSLLNKSAKLVYTYNERLKIFEETGVKVVIKAEFDNGFMDITAENFLNTLFLNCNIRYIVCGYDYKFGSGGFGNVETLKNFCNEKGIGLDIMPEISEKGDKVSSTVIRNLLLSGDIKNANLLLKRPYFIEGKTEHGKKIGSLHLYPTINTAVGTEKLKIAEGVYYTNTEIGGKVYKSVTNCGYKPTLGDESYTVETFVIDYNGEIYGKTVTVIFYERLRDIKKFDSVKELKEQITADIKAAKSL